jgi:hypothetical protein
MERRLPMVARRRPNAGAAIENLSRPLQNHCERQRAGNYEKSLAIFLRHCDFGCAGQASRPLLAFQKIQGRKQGAACRDRGATARRGARRMELYARARKDNKETDLGQAGDRRALGEFQLRE